MIRSDNGEVSPGGAKPKGLLAALLIQSRQVVSTTRLIDLLWDESPPRTASALVHTYVAAVRRALATAGMPTALITCTPGYLLDIDQADSDLATFQLHMDAARHAERRADPEEATRRYEQAVGLWRGPAFGGADANFTRTRAAWLEEERLSAEEGLARCLLTRGRSDEALSRLTRLVTDHPLREESRACLMRALYLTGRQADALAAYRDVREHLRDQLGVEPGEKLRELHAAILAGALAPVPDAVPRPIAGPAGEDTGEDRDAHAGPLHLPPNICDFTGHDEHLAKVLRLGRANLGNRTGTAISVISGFGGAGKSSLAIHAAHRLRPMYPDGQLFADLRGADRDITTHEVLGRFLGALGIAPANLPDSTEDRIDLYRSRVSGRRVIIVLDNAHGEHQVRGLLPSEPNCMVIITSRSRLTSLDGVEPVELGFFSATTSMRMLTTIVGERRVAAEQHAAETIVRLCGGVPLAIRIAAAKLLARPHWPLRTLASRLSDERRRLDELAAGDLAIRSSLRLSYTELDEPHRRAFHLLALLDLPDFGSWLASPLLDIPLDEAEELVEQLVDLRLLEVAGLDLLGRIRYRLHDLVQLFGIERATCEEPTEAVATAVGRTLAIWTALVEAGARRMPRMTLGVRLRITVSVRLDARLSAEVETDPTRWLRSETAAVVRTMERAHELGIDGPATTLITSLLSSPFAVRNEFDGWQRTHEVTLAAARRSADRRAEAVVLTGLGQLHYEKDDFATALKHFRQAAELAATIPDHATLAVALVGTGTIRSYLGELVEAERDLAMAAELAERTGDHGIVAATSYRLGAVNRDQGDITTAITQLAHCAELYRELSDRRGEGLALRGLGLCHRARGDVDAAAELSEQARTILWHAGDELGATYATQSLAKARIRQGRFDDVTPLLDNCLAICTRLADRFGTALVTRTRGELALAAGDLREAAAMLSTALDQWSNLGLPIWRARTLRDLAAATSPYDPSSSATHWASAITLFNDVKSREMDELAGTTPTAWLQQVRHSRPVITWRPPPRSARWLTP